MLGGIALWKETPQLTAPPAAAANPAARRPQPKSKPTLTPKGKPKASTAAPVPARTELTAENGSDVVAPE